MDYTAFEGGSSQRFGSTFENEKSFHLQVSLKFFWDRILKNGARCSEYMYKTLLSWKGLVWNLIERAKVLQTSYLAIPPPKSRGFGIPYFIFKKLWAFLNQRPPIFQVLSYFLINLGKSPRTILFQLGQITKSIILFSCFRYWFCES